MEVIAARGARYARRRRALRGGVGIALVVVVSVATVSLVERNSDPRVVVATEGAGPPVSYSDPAGDAYRLGSSTSRPEFDIVQVGWAPASDAEQPHGGYSTSIKVAGPARGDGYYVSYGDFPSEAAGEHCQAYYFLTPGTTAFANVFCGQSDAGTRRLVDRAQGSTVTATATTDGGTLVHATFDDSTIPPALQTSGRLLSNLSAFTCDENTEFPACGSFEGNSDFVTSTLSYRV
jgi:hypothetical protein